MLVAPIVIPLLTGLVLAGAHGHHRRQWISLAGGALTTLAACWVVVDALGGNIAHVQLGNWPAPLAITLVSDQLSGPFVGIAALAAACVLAWSAAALDRAAAHRFHGGYHFLVAGVMIGFLTGDLFNFFVAIEVTLIASYVLIGTATVGPGRVEAFRYLVINLVGSTLYLFGSGAAYAYTGTLNLAELASRLAGTDPAQILLVAGPILVALAIKSAVFPLSLWLPDAYPASNTAVNALFASLLTKLGIYALYRIVGMVLPVLELVAPVLLVLSVPTMVLGVLGAYSRSDVRGILSFHIVSQIGYMIMGLGLISVAGIAAGLFMTVHNMIVKTALLLIGGVVEQVRGTGELKRLGGMVSTHPLTALLFFVSAMALAGVPPLSGFWPKFGLVLAGLDAGQIIVTAAAILTALFTLLSMAKVWAGAFWGEAPAGAVPRPEPVAQLAPIAVLALAAALLGLVPDPAWRAAERAAQAIRSPAPYIETILAPAPAPVLAQEEERP